MGRTLKDITGEKFQRLTAIKYVGKDKNGKSLWLCLCDCGNEVIATLNNLQRGNTKSCGCLNSEKTIERSTKHGKRGTRLYNIWSLMKNRCSCEKNPCYHNYGGRGISVCNEWQNDFEAFYDWAISNGYADDLTIDRIDNDGNYEPANCRWITNKQQSCNRRTNRFIAIDGETKTVTEWANILKCSRHTLMRRIASGQEIKI